MKDYGPPEKKYIDNDYVDQPDPTTGAWIITNLNGLAPGTGPTERIGRKIKMVSIQARIHAFTAAAVVGSANNRIVVIYDKQANGAAPVATDIFQDNQANSPMNLNNRERFVVLYDKTKGISALGTGPSAVNYNFFKKCNLDVIFNNGSSGDETDIATGAVYLCTVNDGSYATDAPNFLIYTRIRFTDC